MMEKQLTLVAVSLARCHHGRLFVCHNGGASEMLLLTCVVQNLLLRELCTQAMFSMLEFMCKDLGETTSIVSCYVKPF